jgi:hypothetical protein
MVVKQLALAALGLFILVRDPLLKEPEIAASPRRDERGISQSAESAILLAGAVAIAVVVVALITAFVKAKLAKI